MKTKFQKMIVVALVAAGLASVASAAQAGVWVPGPFGPVYQPTCESVWVQTGPFPGQGFFREVCG